MVPLSERESQLLTLVASGMTNRQVSRTMSISEGTVKVYLSKLFRKTGARNRYQLALFGIRNMSGSTDAAPLTMPPARRRPVSFRSRRPLGEYR
jgi:DNA-binding CsgD family transcriptional regulator